MKREEHEETSLIMFGRRYRAVHEFLDSYFPKYGPFHRVVLHHQLGIDLVVHKFAGSVRPAAEQHIIDDLGSIPGDWREFDFDLEYADSWLSRKTRSTHNLKADLRRLYPAFIHLL